MTSLTLNDDNDIFSTPAGNLSLIGGIDAVLQDCENAMKAQRGEMILAKDKGIPTDDTVWNKTNIPRFTAAARSAILSVDNVESIVSFEAFTEGEDLKYFATIETIYGTAAFNGIL